MQLGGPNLSLKGKKRPRPQHPRGGKTTRYESLWTIYYSWQAGYPKEEESCGPVMPQMMMMGDSGGDVGWMK